MATEPNISGTRTRTLLIIVGIMIIVAVTVALYSFSKGKKPNKVISPTSGIPNNIYITPGAKSSEKYVKLQEEANIAGTKKAAAQGKTFVPTIVGNKSEEENNNFNTQLSNILKDQSNDPGKLSKQLAELLNQLNSQGKEIDNLLRLIKELQSRGYNVEDLEKLLKKLMAEGYNTDELAKLLKQLQNQGYKINDLEALLNRLLKEGNADPNLIKSILDQLLKDRLNQLNDLIKQLQNAGYNTNNVQYLVQQINNPDLDKLLQQLANQGYKTDSLEHLLKQLMDKGYNIFDWNIMLQQLQKDGYSTEELQKLLAMLKAQGKNINNLADLLDALKKTQQPALAQQDTIKDQLHNVFNNNPAVSAANQNKIAALDKEYANILKKQQDAVIAQEQAKKHVQDTMLKNKQLAVNAEAQQKIMNEILNSMRAEIDTDLNMLNNIPPQNFTQGDLAAGKVKEQESNAQQASLAALAAAQQTNNDSTIIKAGTILFAVLETAVNSDEPGPVLARIVQPPLKNTKLIGTIQTSTNQNSETLTLNFATANIPERIKSYGLSAVAIDPNTARTALATDVDHHYLLRWGTIFAATFLQGYAKGIAQSGTSVTTSNNGAQTNTVVQQAPLNPRQQFFQGIADMSRAWGQGASQYTNRPITIKIDAGISIGILFTADLVIPVSDEVSIDNDPNKLATKAPVATSNVTPTPTPTYSPAVPALTPTNNTTTNVVAPASAAQQQPPNSNNK